MQDTVRMLNILRTVCHNIIMGKLPFFLFQQAKKLNDIKSSVFITEYLFAPWD